MSALLPLSLGLPLPTARPCGHGLLLVGHVMQGGTIVLLAGAGWRLDVECEKLDEVDGNQMVFKRRTCLKRYAELHGLKALRSKAPECKRD